MMPVVAQTTAWLGLRPVAKAFGISVCAMATLGFGRSICWASRSTIACSSGAWSGVTSFAPIDMSASLSEKKYCVRAHAPMTMPISRKLRVRSNSSNANAE